MVIVAVTAIGVERVLTWSSVQAQREAEAELLFIGEQVTQAIREYYLSPTGTRHELPRSLDDLVYDPRRLGTNRYLRKIFADPLTGSTQWGVVKGKLLAAPFGLPASAIQNGPPVEGIVGIYSLSGKKPIRRLAIKPDADSTYADWQLTIPAEFSVVSSKASSQ